MGRRESESTHADDQPVKSFGARKLKARATARAMLARLRREVAERRALEQRLSRLQKINEALLADIAAHNRTQEDITGSKLAHEKLRES